MARHLIEPLLRAAGDRGRTVEQFLGGFMHQEGPAIRWLDLRRDEAGFVLSLHHALDEGDEHFLDVYSFTPLDEDEDADMPAAEHRCGSLDEALAVARERYGAAADRFVNEGVVQDEYRDYLSARHDRANFRSEES